MQKTIVVKVDSISMHPVVKKHVTKSSRFMAHDEKEEAEIGDVVCIVESRPRSRLKRWVLEGVVKKSAMSASALAETNLI